MAFTIENNASARLRIRVVSFFLFFQALCVNGNIFGQTRAKDNSILVRCVLPKVIHNNDDLNAKMIVKNISDSAKWIYTEVTNGLYTGEFVIGPVNLNIIVQKKEGNSFRRVANGASFDPGPNNDTVDRINKKWVAPQDSVINYFAVDSDFEFEIGNYRMRVIYLNNVLYNIPAESEWVYFKVVRNIHLKHYRDKK